MDVGAGLDGWDRGCVLGRCWPTTPGYQGMVAGW